MSSRKTAKEILADSFRELSGIILHMIEINFRSLTKRILRSGKTEKLDEKTEMLIRLYVLGTVQLSCEYILGKYQADPVALAEVYELALPEPLKPYLC